MKKKSAKKRISKKEKLMMKMDRRVTVYIIASIILIALLTYFMPTNSGSVAVLETNYGTIEIELYDDMPITTENFKNLIEAGVYDGVIFHRIIDNFMIQGGDPTGTGYGDPTIPKIKDEFTHADGNKNNRGTISMANAGPNTGSSQFFINLVNNNFLDSAHPAFGEVISGMDIVDTIAKVEVGLRDKPVEDVIILSASLK